ncbi:lipopolysaccharide biosynthesis protein [Luteibaculum oceani]|uniref:Oligosaccharide flippase family protein n=1 Tax=Luteibaculum oceani TaxID=1294296 RepID=A0A5C6V9M1_9FLAO|nr:oligosaccharide flippase family protein [Luteibaculum oceani]TXC81460.1 oligosaccharide flippase family protein [Luteibaculum oceani]
MKQFISKNKSILQLSGANFLVLALPTLLLPVFSRLYTVSDFAVFGIYSTVIGIFMPFLSGHYQQAIPVPNDKNEITALSRLSLILLLFSTLLISLVWLYSDCFRSLFDPENMLHPYFLWIPLGLLLGGYVQIIQHWILQGGLFTRYAASKSTQAVGQSVVRYFAGVKAISITGGLIYSFVAGLFFQSIVFGTQFKPEFQKGFNGVCSVAKKYSSFLRFGLISAIFFALANFLPLTFLAHFFSENEVGQYSLAMRLGSVPVFVLASSFGQVYFAKCKKESGKSQQHTYELLQKLLRISSYVIIGGSFLLIPVGKLVFGSEWLMALKMTLILLPGLWLNFLVLPLTNLFELGNRQDLSLKYSIWALVLKLGLMLVGVYFFQDVYEVMAFFMVGMVISGAIGWYLCAKIVSTSSVKLLKNNYIIICLAIFSLLIQFMFFNS